MKKKSFMFITFCVILMIFIGCKHEVVHVHTEDDGTIVNEPTCWTKGLKTYKCSECDEELRSVEIPELEWCEKPIDAQTFSAVTGASKYVYFGVFPKTICSSSVKIYTNRTMTMGSNTYYQGTDGEWYIKEKERGYYSGGYGNYSNGDLIRHSSSDKKYYRYFKVEPIKWRVITNNYNNTEKVLLHADQIITVNEDDILDDRIIGDKTIYQNNYKYSRLRAYLNGKHESDDTLSPEYNNVGFLQTAFTENAQLLIENTEVNNAKETTGYSESTYAEKYVCENTVDKIFLLSVSELTNEAYGFLGADCEDVKRKQSGTDYAKANHLDLGLEAWKTNNSVGKWCLRSPSLNSGGSIWYCKGKIYDDGTVGHSGYGIVPALTITLE